MRKNRLSGERGATLVEFAIATTVFFLLVFGGIQFARAIWQSNIAANAAKSAARWAAVRGTSSGQAGATVADVHNFIVTQMYGYSETDTVTWNPTDKKQGSTVQVTVQSDYVVRIPFFPVITIPLRSVAQMIIVR